MMKERIQPIIKWAGGKSQLLNELLPMVPEEYGTYYEPFLGGAAMLLAVQPAKAVVGDLNEQLVYMYLNISLYHTQMLGHIQAFDASIATAEDPKNYYNYIRNLYNTYRFYDYLTSAEFIFLNKHCFNGLYRTNKKGEFNVPFNGSTVHSIDENNFKRAAEYLSNNEIIFFANSYECTVENAAKGDFVFFDPPYDNSFTDYTKEGFGKEDQEKLAQLFKELTDRGCKCMLTNHDTELIRNLYGEYNIKEVEVRRSINRDGKNRKGKEVIITNY